MVTSVRRRLWLNMTYRIRYEATAYRLDVNIMVNVDYFSENLNLYVIAATITVTWVSKWCHPRTSILSLPMQMIVTLIPYLNLSCQASEVESRREQGSRKTRAHLAKWEHKHKKLFSFWLSNKMPSQDKVLNHSMGNIWKEMEIYFDILFIAN